MFSLRSWLVLYVHKQQNNFSYFPPLFYFLPNVKKIGTHGGGGENKFENVFKIFLLPFRNLCLFFMSTATCAAASSFDQKTKKSGHFDVVLYDYK